MIPIEVWPAVLAGLIAGAVMEGPVYLQKALGLRIKQNIFRTWGILLGMRGPGGYFAGFLFHEVLAAVIAIGYAVFFRLLGVEANLWLWGLLGAVIHYALAGPVVKMIPSLDPETGEIGKQGFAYRNYGAPDVVTSLVGHLTFGVLTGILYGLFHSGGGTGVAF
jgi:hypothetical protein